MSKPHTPLDANTRQLFANIMIERSWSLSDLARHLALSERYLTLLLSGVYHVGYLTRLRLQDSLDRFNRGNYNPPKIYRDHNPKDVTKEYLIHLNKRRVVHLKLPKSLTSEEARHLCSFINEKVVR